MLLFLHSNYEKWSVGQGVKTPPFHGGITGSIPVRSTNFKPLAVEYQWLKAFFITPVSVTFYLVETLLNSLHLPNALFKVFLTSSLNSAFKSPEE